VPDDDPMENDAPRRPHGKRPKPRCGAHARSTGKPCRRGSGAGTSHPGSGLCSHHGGSSPGGAVQAERLAAETAAERLGLLVSTTAAEAMQDGLDRANGVVIWLLAQIGALNADSLTWGITQRRVKSAPGGKPTQEITQASRVHPLFGMYERAETRLVRIAAEMSRLGIEQKHNAAIEREGALMFAVLDGMLREFVRTWQLSAEQEAEARAIIARQLRQMSAIESGKDDDPG
jgi:hypothetical protein